MSERRVYFAFVDGSLDYDCQLCGGRCCVGCGFGGAAEGAVGRLIDNTPQLLPWVGSSKGGFVDMQQPGVCLFRRADGLCGVEVDFGRSRKPEVCLMYPFNRLVRIGRTLAVAPNILNVCPVQLVVPPRPGRWRAPMRSCRMTSR